MVKNSDFVRVKEERKNMSFFKIFQGADLSSEVMRALPYNFMRNISEKDFSYKMVIRTKCGSSWKVDIAKNPRFYYLEKQGWNQFVSDNALGQNEFITLTHRGSMYFDVNIFNQNGKEIIRRKKLPTMASPSGVKKEPGESSGYKGVKKEEETSESVGVVVSEVRRKKPEESKSSKKKKNKSKKGVTSMETGESSRGRKKGSKSSKKKEIIQINNVGSVPEFKITIRNSYLKFLAIPKNFEQYLPRESEIFKISHPNGKDAWKVLCLVREVRSIFSKGWSKIAREYPMLIDDEFTFKLIKPKEFLLVLSKKSPVDITP